MRQIITTKIYDSIGPLDDNNGTIILMFFMMIDILWNILLANHIFFIVVSCDLQADDEKNLKKKDKRR